MAATTAGADRDDVGVGAASRGDGARDDDGSGGGLWQSVLADFASKAADDAATLLMLGDASSGKTALVDQWLRHSGVDPGDASMGTRSGPLRYTFLPLTGGGGSRGSGASGSRGARSSAGDAAGAGGGGGGGGGGSAGGEGLDSRQSADASVSVWTLSDAAFKHLLGSALTDAAVQGPRAAVITLDGSKPWRFMEALTTWLEVLTEAMAAAHDRLPRGTVSKLKDSVKHFLQRYSDPGAADGDLADAAAAASGKGDGDAKARASGGDDEAAELAPLRDGVLSVNLGIPIVVVVGKADMMTPTDGGDLTDEQLEFAQARLRDVCLTYGAALVYTSADTGANCGVAWDYIVHRLRPGSPFKQRAQTIESRTKVFVPAGWDSPALVNDCYRPEGQFSDETPFEEAIVEPLSRRRDDTGAEASAAATVVAETHDEFMTHVKKYVDKDDKRSGRLAASTAGSAHSVADRGSHARDAGATSGANGGKAKTDNAQIQDFFSNLLKNPGAGAKGGAAKASAMAGAKAGATTGTKRRSTRVAATKSKPNADGKKK